MPPFDFVLAGRYRLLAPLGEGGMAAVYRARDLRLNREVAVKVLHDALMRDPLFLQRFQREAQMVASLSHPRIVPVYDVGEDSGSHFIVMEYVRGRTLREAIERDGCLPPERAVAILSQVLEALAYAHGMGLVHRDVKPHNVLLSDGDTARLADFGIAHLVDGSTTRTAAILGSAHYLSPEQARGDEASARSDLYACGIVLYEMLTGRPPFEGPNALAIATHHVHTVPPRLPDSQLDRIVQQALAKDPEDRFEDAETFRMALDGASHDITRTALAPLLPASRPAAVQQRPAVEPLVVRRSTRRSYALGALVLLVVAVATYLLELPLAREYIPGPLPSGLLAVPAALLLAVAWTWLQARSWRYSLDGDAAVVQWGVVTHHRFGMPVHQIATVQLKQSLIDRLLGVGTLELYARDPDGAERRMVMGDVPRPRSTYDEILRQIGRSVYRLPAEPL